ncbi:MAG: bifunctional glutamate N-acetyltransferase/amino-acid acetyltransferase ArgJ [Bacillota bacterium]|jgi:glutamate N-acetyltransferase/amino-acid N-acetyltransferase|nr:bifunctional glutamate N-acetyltransferase/amino-acid acetyltransferase ArgJ [Clostridia bacterium]
MEVNEIPGGVTAALGFHAAGVHAGIKKSKKPDVAIIFSEVPAQVGGVFTQNRVKAAPVLFSQKVVAKGTAQAIVVNSGNANACTGRTGEETAGLMAIWAAEELGIKKEHVVVSSTGVIGQQLPRDIIKTGIKKAAANLSREGGNDAARAILTTDKFSKEIAIQAEFGDALITVGGICKGSGMIHPNMATMLAFITTDASVEAPVLQQTIKNAADKTFNMVTVDGDTSTNDMAIILANGKAGNPSINEKSPFLSQFQKMVDYVCMKLAKMLAMDGEGASKLLEVQVNNALSEQDARKAAKAVASSSLVKSAVFGEDANWGRILCAVGYSGANIDPETVEIWLESAAGREKVAELGTGLEFNEENAKKILQEKEIKIIIDLHQGKEGATAWGCDLTYDYVKINADYRT